LSETRFDGWFKQNWADKKELLAHRHRVDCDPFGDILGIVDAAKAQRREDKSAATACAADNFETPTATSAMITEKDLTKILADITSTTGSDQLLVCVRIIRNHKVYTHKFCSAE
jgi:hypothetical protein